MTRASCRWKRSILKFKSSEDVSGDEVVVQHSYAGLNFIDTYYRSGLYKQPLPFIGGGEMVGKVVYAGETARSVVLNLVCGLGV